MFTFCRFYWLSTRYLSSPPFGDWTCLRFFKTHHRLRHRHRLDSQLGCLNTLWEDDNLERVLSLFFSDWKSLWDRILLRNSFSLIAREAFGARVRALKMCDLGGLQNIRTLIFHNRYFIFCCSFFLSSRSFNSTFLINDEVAALGLRKRD